MKTILIHLGLLLAWFYYPARMPDPTPTISAGPIIRADSFPALCPYLTKTPQGELLMSWVRQRSDSTAEFCYAKYNKSAGSFGTAIAIPGSSNIQPHAENLPKIVVKPGGDMIALWGSANPNANNKYAGAVFYAQSFDNGDTWSKPDKLVKESDGIDQRYYDVSLLPSGEVAIIWLDNRKTTAKDGSALYFSSTSGRQGFMPGHLVAEPCCPCCRTKLLVGTNGIIQVLFRGIVQDSIRDMVHATSTDNGKTFSSPRRISEDNWVISGCPHTGPSITSRNSGTYFAWFTGGPGKGCYFTSSGDYGSSFRKKELLSVSGSHPQIINAGNAGLLIVWDEAVTAGGALNRRLAVDWRDESGKRLRNTYISPATQNLSYPVLESLSDGESLVAFGIKEANKAYVGYMKVILSK